MGNFYVNITAKADREALTSLLDSVTDRSVIGPQHNGWLTFSTELIEEQGQVAIDEYGCGVSENFPGPAIAVLNHDDDILSIDLYEGSKQTGTYNSCPGYFDPNATEADLKPVFTNSAAYDALGPTVRDVLSTKSVFAIDAHAAFVEAAGLPKEAVGFGYRYAERGEFSALKLTWAGKGSAKDS